MLTVARFARCYRLEILTSPANFPCFVGLGILFANKLETEKTALAAVFPKFDLMI